MTILVKLLLAHFLGDFVFQPKSWVENKERLILFSPYLYVHLLVHGTLALVILGSFRFWQIVVLYMFIHGVIDVLKLAFQTSTSKLRWFLIDQVLHLMTIFLIWYFIYRPHLFIPDLFTSTFWVYSTALVFLTFVSGVVMQVVLQPLSQSLEDPQEGSLQNAGKFIGILERLFVFTFVVSGNWAAIGFLIAAKSVFRFGDLKESKDRKLTEYILIGTLLSFGIAMATGLFVLALSA